MTDNVDYIIKLIPICRSCRIAMKQYGRTGSDIHTRYFSCPLCGGKRKTRDRIHPPSSSERKQGDFAG